MKKILVLLVFTIGIITSCSKDEPMQEDSPIASYDNLKGSIQKGDLDFRQINLISKKLDNLKKDTKSNIQKSGCLQTVFVPDDFPTIQEAIFAVCEYGNVFVKTGVYNESPGTLTPGIFIKAIGDVTLNGGFGIAADDVKIHGFKIDNADSS